MNTRRLEAFVNLSCVSRSVHSVSWDHAVDGSGQRVWEWPRQFRFVVTAGSTGCDQRCPRFSARIAIGMGCDGECGKPVPAGDDLEG
jgi:hypothetical protein